MKRRMISGQRVSLLLKIFSSYLNPIQKQLGSKIIVLEIVVKVQTEQSKSNCQSKKESKNLTLSFCIFNRDFIYFLLFYVDLLRLTLLIFRNRKRSDFQQFRFSIIFILDFDSCFNFKLIQ